MIVSSRESLRSNCSMTWTRKELIELVTCPAMYFASIAQTLDKIATMIPIVVATLTQLIPTVWTSCTASGIIYVSVPGAQLAKPLCLACQ